MFGICRWFRVSISMLTKHKRLNVCRHMDLSVHVTNWKETVASAQYPMPIPANPSYHTPYASPMPAVCNAETATIKLDCTSTQTFLSFPLLVSQLSPSTNHRFHILFAIACRVSLTRIEVCNEIPFSIDAYFSSAFEHIRQGPITCFDTPSYM